MFQAFCSYSASSLRSSSVICRTTRALNYNLNARPTFFPRICEINKIESQIEFRFKPAFSPH